MKTLHIILWGRKQKFVKEEEKMLLRMKNIGRIHEESSIEINGITVLAGENGSGKSTIGKVLYCIYSSLFDYKEQVRFQRVQSVNRVLRFFVKNRTRIPSRNIEKIEFFVESIEKGEYTIEKALNTLLGIDPDSITDDVVNRINEVLSASEEDVLNAILRRRMDMEFDSQIGHINFPDEDSHLELLIKSESVSVNISSGIPIFENKLNIIKDLVYLDDPYVLDDIFIPSFQSDLSHRENLKRKLNNGNEDDISAVDDVIVNNKLDIIMDKLNEVCAGGIQEGDDGFYYSDPLLKNRLSLINLSTGMKSFLFLKTLLQKGYLEENGIVVLDEPEAHQHPEWMKLYAEIVVLLNKHLGINFVISTHSSEFLSFIELFAKKHDVEKKCRYYMLKKDEKDPTLTNVVDCLSDTETIYDYLTRPFLSASKELDSLYGL